MRRRKKRKKKDVRQKGELACVLQLCLPLDKKRRHSPISARSVFRMLRYQGSRTSQNASGVSVSDLLEVRRGAVIRLRPRMLMIIKNGCLQAILALNRNTSATPRLFQIVWEHSETVTHTMLRPSVTRVYGRSWSRGGSGRARAVAQGSSWKDLQRRKIHQRAELLSDPVKHGGLDLVQRFNATLSWRGHHGTKP